ncbi:protein NDUFAF4 homolog isoform X2 [Pogonomyrmex barbatus]|uniref:Protein NDUFAF4 homolog isoform X2 n=1 Tax=Pogonomyrmex barbatus TaxID=144034 RepID=A0A6I9WCG6_9HYME|nr:protein NDUFAF4 homolog isoform X2 [Pogonomyrmex barbatus]
MYFETHMWRETQNYFFFNEFWNVARPSNRLDFLGNVISLNPHFLEEHYQKNIQLDQRLKDVFVRSTDLQEIKGVKESKSLPQNRQSFYDDFLFESCEYIPVGKCSLKQVFMFLLQHKRDPITYSSENIASEYKLNKKVVDDILKHFKLYIIVTPKDMTEKLEDPFQEMLDKLEMKKKDKEKKQ